MEAKPTAEVYLRRGRVFVAPHHRTQFGFWLSGEPVHELAETDSNDTLGAAVNSALEACQLDFCFDRANRNKWPPVQRAAKSRSWTQFIKGTQELRVERTPDGDLRVVGLSESVEDHEAVFMTAAGSTSNADLGRLVRHVAALTPAHSGRKPYA